MLGRALRPFHNPGKHGGDSVALRKQTMLGRALRLCETHGRQKTPSFLLRKQTMLGRALRLAVAVLAQALHHDDPQKADNARKGIKTHQPRRFLPATITIAQKADNARKGIKTSTAHRQKQMNKTYPQKADNARKGIKTYCFHWLVPHRLSTSESRQCSEGH